MRTRRLVLNPLQNPAHFREKKEIVQRHRISQVVGFASKGAFGIEVFSGRGGTIAPLFEEADQFVGRAQPCLRGCLSIFAADEEGEPSMRQPAEAVFIGEVVAEKCDGSVGLESFENGGDCISLVGAGDAEFETAFEVQQFESILLRKRGPSVNGAGADGLDLFIRKAAPVNGDSTRFYLD